MKSLSIVANMMVGGSGGESSSIASRLSDCVTAPVLKVTLCSGLGGEGRGRLMDEGRGRLRSACEISAQQGVGVGVGAARGIEAGRGTRAGVGAGDSKR
jgi:hypothetical protein